MRLTAVRAGLALTVLVGAGACDKKAADGDAAESASASETSGPYEPPPLEMQITEEADAAPAELAQADRDPDEETPAECFDRCKGLRRELRKQAREGSKKGRTLDVTVRQCQVACQDKCVRQCIERGQRRDLFDPDELESACRQGCVVQR